ncbi:MAG: metallophosphoesterase [Thermodesulfovibrionales bacterium]|nr:metallophosphoesterase [Thermodesulfovibrionales bacterium]
MIIGIMSDSHDDMQRLEAAVEFFNSKGVSQVVHAGDLVSPFTFEILEKLKCPFSGIFGNNDGDKLLLFQKSDGSVQPQPMPIRLGEREAMVVHEPQSVEALAKSGEFDIVIYGHTHVPEIRKVGETIVINPGKVARLHKGESTIALLDTEKLEAEIISDF